MTETPPETGQRARRRSRRPTRRLLLVMFIVLAGISWVFANPPGYAPDEPAHYSKALAVGHGVWTGPRGAYPIGPGFGPRQLQWINRVARVVNMPPHMAPDRFACSVFNPGLSAACLNQGEPPGDSVTRLTYVGTYEPFLYLLPGLAMRPAHNAFTAIRLGRIVIAIISLSLLALAAMLLSSGGDRGLGALGLVSAVTPMVIFLSTELAPNGPEIAAAVCFLAVLLRLSRLGPQTTGVWAAAAASGAVLALSRSLGPFFVAAYLLLFLVIVGPGQAWRTFRDGGRASLTAAVVIIMSIGANLAWGLAVQPHPGLRTGDIIPTLGPAIRAIPNIIRQNIGVFGWGDVPMPVLAYRAWSALVLVVIIVAFVVGRPRQRVFLTVAIVGCIAGTIAVAVFVVQPLTYGFPIYGRYILPLWITPPLCAAEIIRSRASRLSRPVGVALLPCAAVTAAAVHLTAWWTNARRYAVSEVGPTFFPGHSQWTPDGGWMPWFLLVVAAAAGLIAYALLAGSGSERSKLSRTTSRDHVRNGRPLSRAL